ncbi:MAG: preprotein translocase subunit SecA [Bdellovibrionaceae bacterium]|nr:preprotein translocase subunit SecA [Pseudobdellovibrionaceae bacterium]
MIQAVLRKVFGTKHERDMKALQPLISRINGFEPALQALSDEQLQKKTPEFKERLAKGETLDDILPEAFAVCREASRRVLGMRHYDVQLIGGMTLHSGKVAEMRTGEGKTLVATLAVYLNALSGKGVHVVTVNDYLAKRDAEWMGRLYNWLGLSVGIIVHDLTDAQRQKSYGSDITYGTNNEFGFDYLRDNMKFDRADMVQRELNFAIVDECDSILIDEARTPLIISGPAESSTDKYYTVNKVIPHLKRDVHFTMEEKTKTASLTDEGNAKVEELLGIGNLYDIENIELLHHINQGLKAHFLYRRDVEYMVNNGEIVIVDEFTGRLMPGRRWSDGLHQAIEAKEGVEVKSENQTLATITFQNYFRMYSKLAGMTGTADTEAVELKKIYNLDVSVIPTNKGIKRVDHNDVVYKTEVAKFRAIAQDIASRYEKGQPILVGTVSIEKSETLSSFLKKEGVKHEVLNAKHHEREAEIVAQAGRKGAVTIATNMAGRGTDIVLGGNPEMLAKKAFPDLEEGTPEFEEQVKTFKRQTDGEKQDVLAAGGLYIIGTERHESRRIDNQLRGRSGRQGDPGESKFYLSLEDNLMRIFNGEMIQKIMNRMNVPDDEPIVAGMVTRSIEGAQRKVEGHHFDIRKHLLDYDNVMNQQRQIIYGTRRKVFEGDGVERTYLDNLGDLVSQVLDSHIPEDAKKEDWNLEGLNTALAQQFGVQIQFPTADKLTGEAVTEAVSKAVKDTFDRQKAALGENYGQIQKMILLQSIDQKWKEHLLRIDRLKEGISLRGYAQKDPVIEYKKEAFAAFEALNNAIKSDSLEKFLKVQLVSPEQMRAMEAMMEQPDFDGMNFQGGDEGVAGGASAPAREAGPSAGSSGPTRQKARMTLGPGPGPEDGPQMNRAQRRQMAKKRK